VHFFRLSFHKLTVISLMCDYTGSALFHIQYCTTFVLNVWTSKNDLKYHWRNEKWQPLFKFFKKFICYKIISSLQTYFKFSGSLKASESDFIFSHGDSYNNVCHVKDIKYDFNSSMLEKLRLLKFETDYSTTKKF